MSATLWRATAPPLPRACPLPSLRLPRCHCSQGCPRPCRPRPTCRPRPRSSLPLPTAAGGWPPTTDPQVHTQDLEPWAHSRGDPADNTGLASPPPHPEAAGHALLQTPAPDGDAGWQLPGAGGGHLTPKCPPFSDSLKPLLFFCLEVKEKEKRGNYLQHPPPGEGGAGGSEYSGRGACIAGVTGHSAEA